MSVSSTSANYSLGNREDEASGVKFGNISTSNSSLPVLSASSAQAISTSNITVSAVSTSVGSTSYQQVQRHQLSSQSREVSSILPGPSVSSAASDVLNKSNPKGLVGLQNLGNTWCVCVLMAGRGA